jgi:hypothetical protein
MRFLGRPQKGSVPAFAWFVELLSKNGPERPDGSFRVAWRTALQQAQGIPACLTDQMPGYAPAVEAAE